MKRPVELGAVLVCGFLLSLTTWEAGPTSRDQSTQSDTAKAGFRVGVPQKLLTEPAPEPRRSPSGKHPETREPVPGIRLNEIRIKGGGVAILAELDSTRFRPQVVGVTPEQPTGRSALGALNKNNADLVLGSGFLERFYPVTPLGLLVVDGVEISQLSRGRPLSAILAVRKQEIALIPRDAYRPVGTLGAIQTGPWLIQDGVVGISSREPETRPPVTRAFFALCEQGVWLAGVTLDGVHLFHLANFLATPKANGGYACRQAVNLSGGGAEALVVRAREGGEPFLWGNANFRQASLIVFVPKNE